MNEPTGYTALDLIGYTDKGDYSAIATYVKNDLTNYGGTKWRCKIDDTTGVTPTEGVNWTVFVAIPADTTKQIIAPVEGATSLHAYVVGEQLIYNDTLYKVIAPIAVNDALVVDTNIEVSPKTVIEQVEDNASDIEDIWESQNVLGSKNVLQNSANTQTVNSVTFTRNADESWTLNGAPPVGQNADLTIMSDTYFEEGTKWKLSRGGTSNDKVRITFFYPTNPSALTVSAFDDEVIFTIPTSGNYRAYIRVADGGSTSNYDIFPMVYPASYKNSAFAPYAMTNGQLTKDVTSLQNCKYHTHESGTKTITCTNQYQQFLMTVFKGSARAVYLITQAGSLNTTHLEQVYLTSGQTAPGITVTNTGTYTFTINLPSSTQTNISSVEPFTVA